MATFDAPLVTYAAEADVLLEALHAGDDAARWRIKWLHPQFAGRGISDVRVAALTLADAQAVVARDYGFGTWNDLEAFIAVVSRPGPVRSFETAVEFVLRGDLVALERALDDAPSLARASSTRRHHATLLHYLAANGVEAVRQHTPPNALAVATLLLDRGAEVDALADMYDERCTTLSLLVSSSPPAHAGLQTALALLLVDRGAALVGPGSKWQSAVRTALVFGFLDTARALAVRAGAVDHLIDAAGLGLTGDLDRLCPSASPEEQRAALSVAAQHGQAQVVSHLLQRGIDPNAYNPDGFHAHSTPLHQAVWAGHSRVVEVLVHAGARLDLRDRIYDSTPLGWAEYGGRAEIAAYLRDLADRQ